MLILSAVTDTAFADNRIRIGNLIITGGENIPVLPWYQTTSVCGDEQIIEEEQPTVYPTENPSVCLSPVECSDDIQQACGEQCGENKECLIICITENSSKKTDDGAAVTSYEKIHSCGTPEECLTKIKKDCSLQCGGEENCFMKCMENHRDEWNPNPGHHAIDPEKPFVDTGILIPSDDFLTDISELAGNNQLGSGIHTASYYTYPEEITESLARLYDWFPDTIGVGRDIIVHFNLSWSNGVSDPLWDTAACGFFSRSDSGDMLLMEMNHMGFAEIRNGMDSTVLSYNSGWYGTNSANGKASVTMAITGSDAAIIYEHKIAVCSKEIPLTDPGYWGFYVRSGSDTGFGTRCTYSDIEVVVFDNQ